jgi:hypothetical protein
MWGILQEKQQKDSGKCHNCRWQLPEMSLANAVETADNGTEQ